MKTTKTFKSGNSVAVRLPKGLGIEAGTEVRVREERGKYVLEPVEHPKRKFNVAKVWVRQTGLELIKPEDRIFAERKLLWDDIEPDQPRTDPK